jgi:hypothetical protein
LKDVTVLGRVVALGGRRSLFVFNDTIEGPRAPAVKPGQVNQAELTKP